MIKNKPKEKFQYGNDLQEDILKYTVTDINGYKAIEFFEAHYFDLVEHQVAAELLKQYFKKKKRIPSKALLKEELRVLLFDRQWRDLITKDDEKLIQRLFIRMYKGIVKEGDEVFEKCVKFSQFVQFKQTLETADIHDFNTYGLTSKKIQKILTISSSLKDERGIFLVNDIRSRQLNRQIHNTVIPFPFAQLNKLTNAGGYQTGAIICIVDKAKGFKTGVMANLAKGYMRLRQRIIIFDLENGEDSLALRLEQSISNKTKTEVLSGEYDEYIQKIMRKYKRLGVEVIVKRIPAFSNANVIRKWLDFYKNEYGLTFQKMFIDYIGLMAAISGTKEERDRISEAYMDIKNVAEEYKIERVYTPHHITREGMKRRATCYEPNDTAKCIDIHRHVDMMIGINQTPEEEENGVYRLEVIDQRDGVPNGRAYFWGDEARQRITEFTRDELQHLHETQAEAKPEAPVELKQRKSALADD